MKKLITLFACVFVMACSEKKISVSDVPAPAVSAFNAKYPNASGVKWIKEKKSEGWIFEASFSRDGKKVEAEFDSTGNFLEEDQ